MLSPLKCLLMCSFLFTSFMVSAITIKYPQTKTVDHIDHYFGTAVKDPYRWLEEDVRNSEAVAQWVKDQNEVTFSYLKQIPGRDKILARLKALNNYDAISAPNQYGERYFYAKKSGLQNHSVFYVTDNLDKPGKVLLDPNTWSKDGSVALSSTKPSPDGEIVAYMTSESGSDWKQIKLKSVSGSKGYSEVLRWIKFSSIQWAKDGSGFYYSGFPKPAPGQDYQSLNLGQKLYFHRLGTEQKDDLVVYESKANPDWGFSARVSDDGKVLLINIRKGTDDRARVKYLRLDKPGAKMQDLITDFTASMNYVGNDGNDFYFTTNDSAPNNRLIKINLNQIQKAHWQEIVPEQQEVLRSAVYAGGKFFLGYLKDVASLVKIANKQGESIGKIELPGIGTVGQLVSNESKTHLFYAFTSFNYPNANFIYDIKANKSRLLSKTTIQFNPDDYSVSQVFYKSKDNTRIPMFITHKKGLKRDGKQPTILYGYGGFNVSLTPRFSPSIVAWLEMGGVYAVANLRGGGEYGKTWHQAGTKLDKQNVFDDFIAGAEYLIEEKYTNSKKLAVRGGSNGGLLVGAVINQRPDLFAVGVPAVGVMDMLRFQHFTAGRYWVDDYGSSADPNEFKALLAYSPYHNIKQGTKYPAVLVLTGDTDDRVVPSHSFKYISALQAAQSGDNPVMIRVATKTGHGAGKSLEKRMEEFSDVLAFVMKNMGMTGL